MPKYSFDRLEPKQFEAMSQALLEKIYRVGGNLIQFGDGQDGGREATWTQPVTHPLYIRPRDETTDVGKEWIFQVKYHDISQRGWEKAREAIIEDLEKELNKIVNKHDIKCHAYVMITNVPFTGVRNVGTRDKITTVTKRWEWLIPEIYVWDAADISCMIDADQDVRTAYFDLILPGDILKAIYQNINSCNNRKQSSFQAHLKYVLNFEKSARAQEAGDEQNLPLSEVFIDFRLTLLNFGNAQENSNKGKREGISSTIGLLSEHRSIFSHNDGLEFRASNALFLLDSEFILLLGGPGLGKTTLTQFLSLYQAARLIDSNVALSLAKRLKLPQGINLENFDSYVSPRFPFRIELRRYAKWMSEQFGNNREPHLALYIIEKLINENTSSDLVMDDIFELASTNPILLILDGLDEVPNPETRQKIIENLRIFINRIESENGNLQVILSSRPNGYSGEFDEFKPVAWKLNELDRQDFNEYCEQWLKLRIPSTEEQREAKERIEAGMESEAVQRLASSLLQATVILTIVRRKIQIPHQKHSLYQKYVEVIFEREKEKTQIVREWEKELLQLHERVGFELHIKMEKTRINSLTIQDFYNYVYEEVLANCLGTKIGTKKVNEVAQEIVDMATDRLCLLVGKGEKQAEIDFVLQQYREYFAASYLTNHPDADPDRVFSMLIKRGAYWSYVLQFYVAQAHPNQQKNWLEYVDEEDEVINKTRASRAIIDVLPEFKLSKSKDWERALKILFDKQIRWTWIGQESLLDILQVTHYGYALSKIWQWIDELSIEDLENLESELWLLGKIYSLNFDFVKANDKKFESKIQEMIEKERTKNIAILVALNNDLQVNLSSCDLLEFESAFDNIYDCYENSIVNYKFENVDGYDNIIMSQSCTKLCEFMLGSSLGKFMRINLPERLEISLWQDSVVLELNSYVCGKFITKSDLSSLNLDTANTDNLYVNYLQNLISLTNNLTNNELEQKIRELEKKIIDNSSLRFIWSTDNLLGPDLTAFNSIDDWRLFRQELIKLSTEDPYWIVNNMIDFDEDSSSLWSILFFHPNHWPLLVEEELITDQEYQNILGSPLANILAIPTMPINLFNGWSASTHGSIQLTKLLNVAIKIAQNNGVKYLGDAKGLDGILCHAIIEQPDDEDTEFLLFQAISLSPLPRIWAGALFLVCLHTSSLNLDNLVIFWQTNKDLKRISLFNDSRHHSFDKSDIINYLLCKCNQNTNILPLITAIIESGASIDKNTQNKIYDQLFSALDNYLDDEPTIILFCQALLNLPLTIKEFEFWQQPKVIQVITKSSYYLLNRINQRFLEISYSSSSQLNYQNLRNTLNTFIEQRKYYPLEIVLSALEAILKIDELNSPELKQEDWHKE